MNFIAKTVDSVQNFVAQLGMPGRDKAASSSHVLTPLSPVYLVNMYRAAWLPRKIVDAPAQDATRKWRNWHADAKQIELLEAEEKRLNLKALMQSLLIEARLRGGAAIYIGTNQNPASPLRLTTTGMIQYLTLLTRDELSATQYVNDVRDPRHGLPAAYQVGGSGSMQVIHPSRLVVMQGNKVPRGPGIVQDGWGDSVLQSCYDAIMQSDGTMANIASLVFEAKIDIMRIPDFLRDIGDPDYKKRIIEMGTLAVATKGINGTMFVDKEIDFVSTSATMANLPELADRFLQAVAGAADIPATRLLGQSPAGLSATGESDTRNYYDRIQSMQNVDMTPAMSVLDNAVIVSALGTRPANVHYKWATLWQSTGKELADIGKTLADTFKTLKESGVVSPQVLDECAVTTLVESGAFPGLDQAEARDKGNTSPDDREADTVAIGDAAPRTLYVSRRVLNVAELAAWAKGEGLTITSEGGPLHVTIAHSSTPVDWIKMGNASMWGDDDGILTIAPGGPRVMEVIGKGANALHFASSQLSWRNAEMREAGAGWDFEDYSPHITINYEEGIDLTNVKPYQGKIVFGPEIFEELK